MARRDSVPARKTSRQSLKLPYRGHLSASIFCTRMWPRFTGVRQSLQTRVVTRDVLRSSWIDSFGAATSVYCGHIVMAVRVGFLDGGSAAWRAPRVVSLVRSAAFLTVISDRLVILSNGAYKTN
jgi:hypothetical protein